MSIKKEPNLKEIDSVLEELDKEKKPSISPQPKSEEIILLRQILKELKDINYWTQQLDIQSSWTMRNTRDLLWRKVDTGYVRKQDAGK